MKVALTSFAALALVGGYFLAALGNNAGAGITYGAAVFCLIFAFLSRFKRFKGLGIEAELWEEKQEEAAALVDQLQQLRTELQRLESAHLAMLEELKPRDLSVTQIEDFAAKVKDKVKSITIYTVPGSEPFGYAQGLREAFERGNAQVQVQLLPRDVVLPGIAVEGVTIYEFPDGGDAGVGMAIFKAFSSLNLPSLLQSAHEPMEGITSPALFVGAKPEAFRDLPGYLRSRHPEFPATPPPWGPSTSLTVPATKKPTEDH